MTSCGRRLAASTLVVLLLAVGLPTGLVGPRAARAEAEESAEIPPAALAKARKHFRAGEKLYALGRFQEALDEYEAAFDAAPLPAFLFNIGQCQRNLENYDAAIFAFRKYLRLTPEAENRPAVEELIRELETKQAEAKEKAEAERRRRLVPVPVRPAEPSPAPPRPRPEPTPLYKRTWFLVTVGAALAAGAGTAIYFATSDEGGGLPDSDFGNVNWPL